LKLLKNQIKAVLLDIKENLANGEWQGLSSRWGHEAAGQTTKEPSDQQPVEPNPASEVTQESSSASKVTVDSGEPVRQQTGPVPSFSRSEPVSLPKAAPASSNESGDYLNSQPDLLTVVMLGQWLDRAVATVGKDETEKIVEMYDITGNLPVQMKQTLLLLIDSYGNNGESTRRSNKNSIGLTSYSLLMEMDSLLRYRNRPLEAAVLSLLAERASQRRRDESPRQSRQKKESENSRDIHNVGAFNG
jgi:archaellum component FlaD/FlaE